MGPNGGNLGGEVGPLLTTAPQLLNFAVVGPGVKMPAAQLQQPAPAIVAPAPQPAVRAPAPVAPAPIVYAPKQDRN